MKTKKAYPITEQQKIETGKQQTFQFTAPSPLSSNALFTRGKVTDFVYSKNKNAFDLLDEISLALPEETKIKIKNTQKDYQSAFDEVRKKQNQNNHPVENLIIVEDPFTVVKTKTQKKKDRLKSKKKEDGEISSESDFDGDSVVDMTMAENDRKRLHPQTPIKE